MVDNFSLWLLLKVCDPQKHRGRSYQEMCEKQCSQMPRLIASYKQQRSGHDLYDKG
jgi:hypothetical protein